jgi:hypothetical protein
MIVQNQNTAWVSLALIVLCMAVAFGTILTGVPFGPSQDVKDEQVRVGIRATEGALSAIQTPQAIFADQTAIVAELTTMPPIQTATAIAVEGELVAIQQAATQTKIAEDAYLNNLSVGATATAMAQSMSKQPVSQNTDIGLAAILIGAICIWIIGHILVKVLLAHTQYKFAQARFLKVERQLADLHASRPNGQRESIEQPIPIWLSKHREMDTSDLKQVDSS